MSLQGVRRVVRCVPGLLVGCLAVAAHAEDLMWGEEYSTTQVSGRYVAPPSTATTFSGMAKSDSRSLDLPFDFSYFGWTFRKVWVSSNGFIQFGGEYGYPSDTNRIPSETDGYCSALWDDLNVEARGRVVHWTDGTAPNRRVVVCWDGIAVDDYQPVGTVAFQIQLHETSHRIVFAYKPQTYPDTWLGLTATIGLNAFGGAIRTSEGYAVDQRYVAPFGNVLDLSGHPGTDLQFDLGAPLHVTGRALYDAVVADADGLGNAVEADVPVRGLRIAAVQSDGLEVAAAVSSATGDFDIAVPARSVQKLTIGAFAGGAGCDVRSGSGGTVLQTLAYDQRVWTDVALGMVTVDDVIDPGTAKRPALHMAIALERAYGSAAPFLTASPDRLVVVWDPASVDPTAYTPRAGTAAPMLRVGSAASGDEDAWDAAEVVRAYGRHVLEAAAPAQTTGRDGRFDASSDAQNAFAEAFGYFLWPASHGTSVFVDAHDATSATVIDLDDPQPSTAASPLVTAWVAGALHDLADGADEPHDWVDGTQGGAGTVIRVIDSLTEIPDAQRFFDAWGPVAGDGLALSRLFIHHGLVADDAGEPDDSTLEARDLGKAPVRVGGRVLTQYNEDWHAFRLDEPSPTLQVELGSLRGGTPEAAQLELELHGPAGLLVRGNVVPATRTVLASAGPLAAGTYRARVRHVTGASVPEYSLQVFEPLEIGATLPPEWTVGRPLSHPLTVGGGIPPLRVTVDPTDPLPPGVGFAPDASAVTGAPSEAGEWRFVLRLDDSGDPSHATTSSHGLLVNPPLEVDLGEFLPFPVGRPHEVARRSPGGTAPRAFTVAEGALPEGVSLAPAELVLSGAAAAAGTSPVRIHGVDLAGSEDEAATRLVGCVAVADGGADLDLAAGDDACGIYFDAVLGSTVACTVRTAKGQPRRALRALVLDAGAQEVTGGRVVVGNGKARISGVPCPASGRFFVVLASAAGAATRLEAAVKSKPPKGAKGGVQELTAADPLRIEIGAHAGATLDLSVAPGRGSDAEVRIGYLLDPTGALVVAAPYVTAHKKGFRLRTDLALGGTWTVVVTAAPGTSGAVSYAYRVKNPKGSTWSVD